MKTKKKQPKREKVIIHVLGGVAHVWSCPEHIEVKIIDYDNLND